MGQNKTLGLGYKDRMTPDEDLDISTCIFRSMLSSEAAVGAFSVVLMALCLLSVVVNTCMFFGLGHSDGLTWENRFILLKSLIFSDLLFTLTQGVTVLHCLLRRQTLQFGSWCLVQYYLGTICIFSAILTITMMALERYLYVCHAIHYLSILTTRRMKLALGVVWMFSLAIASTNMMLMLKQGQGTFGTATAGLLCEPDTVERFLGFPRLVAVFRKLTGLGLTIICIFSYFFSYLRMYQEARNAVEPFHQVNVRARRTVLFYVSMFFLQLVPCWLKIMSDALWEVLGTEAMVDLPSQVGSPPGNKTLPSQSFAVLHVSLLLLLFVPPCINPLVYGIRNQEVRQALPCLRWYQRVKQLVSTEN